MSIQSKAVLGSRKRKGTFPPASLVQLLSPEQWEDFIEECCRVQMGPRTKYAYVQRIGSSGDAGRDVEARYSAGLVENGWDLYQAKKYQSAVGESTFFPELAKFFHHLSIGTYPIPRNYFICAPRNTTPSLHDLIAKPDELRKRFTEWWRTTKAKTVYPANEASLKVALEFDFGRIHEFPVKDLIDLHARDANAHAELFGVVAERGENPSTPAHPTTNEQRYIEEILRAYSEQAGAPLSLVAAMGSPTYSEHLSGCRTEFYCAEGLKRFSRDIYPGQFEALLTEVHGGVRRTLASPRFGTGMERMDAVLDQASRLQVSGNPLADRLYPADLPGTCHHLVNEEKIKWVK